MAMMHTLQRKTEEPKMRTLLTTFVLAALLGLTVIAFAAPTQANETYCVVVSVEKNAWVVKADTAVKASLHVGDLLFAGDRLEVYQGNSVDIAFDKESANIVHIEGNSSFQITNIRPTNVTVDKGKVFSLLNNINADRRFQITTPTAIAAVRGTEFQVNATPAGTEIFTYQGKVQVAGRDAAGKASAQSVILEPNQKTSVKGIGKSPEPISAISATERSAFVGVKTFTEGVRDWLKGGRLSDLPQSPDGAGKNQAPMKTKTKIKEVEKGSDGDAADSGDGKNDKGSKILF